MTRRDQFHKWFVYALGLLPLWVLLRLPPARLAAKFD